MDFDDEPTCIGKVGETLDCPPRNLPQELATFKTGLYSVLAISGLIANAVVFFLLCINKEKRDRIRLLSMHLSVADFLVSFFAAGVEALLRIYGKNLWFGGATLCKLFPISRAFGVYASNYIMALIAHHCYNAVKSGGQKGNRRNSLKSLNKTLTMLWLTTECAAAFQAFSYEIKAHPSLPGYQQCLQNDAISSDGIEPAYGILSLLFFTVAPGTLIAFLYGMTIKKLCIMGNKRDCGDEGQSENTQTKAIKKRLATISGLIIFAFYLCWIPYLAMTFWYKSDVKSALQVNPYIRVIIFATPLINSVINPFIYGCFFSNLRQCIGGGRKSQDEIRLRPRAQQQPEAQV